MSIEKDLIKIAMFINLQKHNMKIDYAVEISNSFGNIKQALENKQSKLDKIDELARDGGTIVENYDVLCKIRKILGEPK